MQQKLTTVSQTALLGQLHLPQTEKLAMTLFEISQVLE
jgi:hypothetical protein